MKKSILTFLLATATTIAFSQTINFGIKAGVNLSTLPQSGLPYQVDNKNLTGYHAGIIADLGFQNFSIQPALFFITKGSSYPGIVANNTGNTAKVTTTIKLNYLELPVNLLYKLQATPGVKVYFGGGPYLGYGLSGTWKYPNPTGPIGSYSYKSMSFGTDTLRDYKNPDYGFNFITGVELKKRFTIDLNYSLGLGNIGWDQVAKIRNRSMGLSVGYLFK
jgi:hypothetical protein